MRPIIPKVDRFPVRLWLAITALLLWTQHLGSRTFRSGDSPIPLLFWANPPYYLGGWNQFDGPEYLSIAEAGYTYRQLVWFPLYPMLIRVFAVVLQSHLVSGVVISAIAGLIATLLLWRWLAQVEMDEARRPWVLATQLLYPYGWFLYGVVYSDALFLALAVGAFLCVERGRLAAAAVLGALATATRPTGLAVAVGLTVLALERATVLVAQRADDSPSRRLRFPVQVHLDRLRPRHLAPALSIAGVLAYMGYTWISWGSPLLFGQVQRQYHTPGVWALTKTAFRTRWANFGDDPTYALTIGAQGLLVLLFLAAVPKVWRRFGMGYAAFVLTLVLIPTLSTEDFMGTGRYLIAAFPVFAVFGEWLTTKSIHLRSAVLATGGLLLIGLSFGFSRSWYLT